MDNTELACAVLLVLLVALLHCYTSCRQPVYMDGFGMDNRPFEPENTLLHRNPWDDVDYRVPSYVKKYIPIAMPV